MRAEIAVIGGGAAGAAFAALAADAGRDVLLIEREAGAHDKVCGEFLSREAQLYLAALGLDLARLGAVPIERVRLAAGGTEVSAALPFRGLSLSRRVLDAALLDLAAARGARVVRGRRAEALQREAGEFRLRLAGGDTVSARTAVVATGKHDLRGWKRPTGAQPDLVGFKMYFCLLPEQARALAGHVELMLFRGGYAGLEPVEGGRANLCLLVRRERFAALGRNWPRLLEAIAADAPLLRRRLSGAVAEFTRPLSISGIPYGFVAPGTPDDEVWRLGDQAAVIPSFSGDGMSIALHSAQLAVLALRDGVGAAGFQAQLARDVGVQVARATWLSRIFVRRPAQLALLAAARLLPALMARAAAATRVPDRALQRAGILAPEAQAVVASMARLPQTTVEQRLRRGPRNLRLTCRLVDTDPLGLFRCRFLMHNRVAPMAANWHGQTVRKAAALSECGL